MSSSAAGAVEEAAMGVIERVEAALRSRDRVVVAWSLVVAASALATLLFDYRQLWWGSVILYFTFSVDLIKEYSEFSHYGRDVETVTILGSTVAILYLHAFLLRVVDAVAVRLGAAQVLAIAGLTARAYAVLRNDGAVTAAVERPDPVSHPFMTVGALVTFLLGQTEWPLVGVLGVRVSEAGAELAFFLFVSLGATAGLLVHLAHRPSGRKRAD
ncbi:hypothetical protein [Halarchaeum sp. P4]|uniref:hypothetical protein n=1 Tax=Halarchaeum sp. P4 TaxID=3421639 RepID=UPI003EBE6A0A